MEKTNKLLKLISKKSNLTILLSLQTGIKKWSDFEKLINKKYVHQGLKELISNGLVQTTIINDTPTGSKAYELTPLGKKIVQLIEEMGKEFEKYHSHVSEGEKFVDELLD